jgi:hypothetical protein
MPMPVSPTSTTASSPFMRALTDSQPPFGIASRALRNRFRKHLLELVFHPANDQTLVLEIATHLDAPGLELVLEQ